MPDQNGDMNMIISGIWALAVRRRWWSVGTTCSVGVLMALISLFVANHYRSEATLFVQSPRIPERYVVPNSPTSATDTIDSMSREILSRASLQQIVNDFGLYAKERDIAGSAAVVEEMRKNIELQPLNKDPDRRTINALMIAFTGDDPVTAQRVTSRLVSLFIQANLRAQQDRDSGTTSFLREQLGMARAELEKQETTLRDFKWRYLGELPEQVQGNLQILSGLQIQLQNANTNLARAQQQRTYLESMLSVYAPKAADSTGLPVSNSDKTEKLRADLARLYSERDDLLSRFSPLYPDVVSVNQQIASEEAQLHHLATAPALASAAEAGKAEEADRALLQTDPGAVQLKSQLGANRMEIATAEKESAQLKMRIAEIQERLSQAPVREQQLAEVQRNYDLSKQNYADLLSKATQSELATRMQMQQGADQFQVIDPPSLPRRPSSPQRLKISLAGLLGGLFLGMGLAIVMEMRDSSFHLEKDVRAYFAVPLVVGLPELLSPPEVRKRSRRAGLDWALACVLVLMLVATQLYVLQKA